MKGILYLEDGTLIEGCGFGYIGTSIGELVFNTSMTGYQEILTDPSYAGQIITMTYPLIGNYGTNIEDKESPKVHASGFVVRTFSKAPSNFKSEGSIEDMLIKMKIVGISDVDTRQITKKIRENGTLKCVISNQDISIEKLDELVKSYNQPDDWMKKVGTKEKYSIEGKDFNVALIDFGVKNNIIENLKERNCNITVFPHDARPEDILGIKPDGVLLSNGPGDPKLAENSIKTAKELFGKVPMFGICLGHQIIALALGADTYKMKFGHRGSNHGVYDIERDRAYITSQNHGYAVDPESLTGDMIITHKNLNDNTVEGIRHTSLPVFSVQFHPEGAPGPDDTTYLFDKFIQMMKEEK
ncbi:MAG: glutamine-hydrolyzing carbamoyl-phosphate synthase small subunit [Bacillota bacterium]|nr:glutamine-hydrolyzing carbamoyl-phosphate synthase small subunit [Bacillota bacterium]